MTAGPAGKKYFAASVPRYLRTTRLSHLPVQAVIGSWAIENPDDINQTFDVVMLPEVEFRRARNWLAQGMLSTPALQRGSLQAAYSLRDIREVTVPPDAPNPYQHAAQVLARLFDLDIRRTVYADAPSVVAATRHTGKAPLRVELLALTDETETGAAKDFLAAPVTASSSLQPARRTRRRIVF